MTASDLIFWYTGSFIWGIIGVCILLALLLGFAAGAYRGYLGGREWIMLRVLGKAPREKLFRALRDSDFPIDDPKMHKELWRWLFRFRRRYGSLTRDVKAADPELARMETKIANYEKELKDQKEDMQAFYREVIKASGDFPSGKYSSREDVVEAVKDLDRSESGARKRIRELEAEIAKLKGTTP